MSSSKIVILSAVAGLVAATAVPYPPPGYCVVSLTGSGYSSLALRPTPCNNQGAILYMSNGQMVEMLSTKEYYGCGWEYLKVAYTDQYGRTYQGYAGEDFLACNQPAPSQQSCGSWAVKYGGSPNACGSGYYYSASDSDHCDASGDNCKTVCCTKQQVVYRRDTDEDQEKESP
jgi:hypothetical protein